MTVGQQDRRAVGVFSSNREVEDALNELKRSDFPMNKVSVIARDAEQRDKIAGADVNKQAGDEAKEGAGSGAVAGTVLGGIGGLLVGLGTLIVPGAGPFLAAGTIATTFAGAGVGAVSGGLIGALTNLGISKDRAEVYAERVNQGDYLVIVDGSESEIRQAESILNKQNVREWAIFNTPNY